MDKKFPKSKLGWLWENMKGKRALFMIALLGTVVYNILQLTVPYISSELVDTFLTGEHAAENWATNRNFFFVLIGIMVGVTILRTVIVYLDCMGYEHVSQHVLYRVRNYLYDKIQRQDMKFYSTYRTGDLMTRVTGDLDAVRHMVAWVIRVIIESFALYTSAMIYFFVMNWKLALCIMVLSPFIFGVIYMFRTKVRPMHAKLREKLAEMNTYAQENISGNRVVKAFAREEYEKEKFDKANTSYKETNQQTALVWVKFYPAIEGMASAMSVALLVIGGLFLIWRKVISPIIPCAFIGTVFVIALLVYGFDFHMAIFHICAGGVMLGAFFMATDYVTTPKLPLGKLIFGIGCGVITMAIRVWGSYPEGVSFSILLMNICTPLINRLSYKQYCGGGMNEK